MAAVAPANLRTCVNACAFTSDHAIGRTISLASCFCSLQAESIKLEANNPEASKYTDLFT